MPMLSHVHSLLPKTKFALGLPLLGLAAAAFLWPGANGVQQTGLPAAPAAVVAAAEPGSATISDAAEQRGFLPVHHEPAANRDTGLSWSMAASLIAKLGLVIVLIYLAARGLQRFLRGAAAPAGSRGAIRVVEAMHLAPHRALYVVELDTRRFLIGATETQLSLLGDLSPPPAATADTMPAREHATAGSVETPEHGTLRAAHPASPQPDDFLARLRESVQRGAPETEAAGRQAAHGAALGPALAKLQASQRRLSARLAAVQAVAAPTRAVARGRSSTSANSEAGVSAQDRALAAFFARTSGQVGAAIRA